MSEKIAVENVNVPGHVTNVDAAKYHAMKEALLAVLPAEEPGMVVKDALTALKPNLPQDLFPEGKTSGWWQKCVQLDLEAKGLVRRLPTKPMRLIKLRP
ncbi:MAG: hypothetical protein JJ908_13255 [Rhizobiales bacterium]|nr:hypothetical protein [Hyphomicrobiales bacterium]MBO6699793.1 hypothetical protein [Hyphomicrobiales bacterium]MBO6737331.1 hypothetical protein [Hyphomicrobiales bacterium]MBO6911595.1 hypothetical protein [Hyphomicrobiales bacterium]MBO6954983.1 hypothetical protein [Hyphomicrobiales bacterium]